MTNEEAKGRLESFIDTFNICKEHDNALVAVSISKEDIQAFTMAIEALEQQPCEDAISQKIDEFKVIGKNAEVWIVKGKLQIRCLGVIHNIPLPSVMPKEKTGKWIYKQGIFGAVYCSKCDFELKTNNTKYCPNCGAKMVEPQESEDKG